MSFSKNINKLMLHAIEKYDVDSDNVALAITNIKNTLKKTSKDHSSLYTDMIDYTSNTNVVDRSDEYKILEENILKPSTVPITANELETIPGWKKLYSETNQRDYWFNEKTGETSWVRPGVLSGWRQLYSETYKRYYWFNDATGETSWDAPLKGGDNEELNQQEYNENKKRLKQLYKKHNVKNNT
jgi:hypothetical protein